MCITGVTFGLSSPCLISTRHLSCAQTAPLVNPRTRLLAHPRRARRGAAFRARTDQPRGRSKDQAEEAEHRVNNSAEPLQHANCRRSGSQAANTSVALMNFSTSRRGLVAASAALERVGAGVEGRVGHPSPPIGTPRARSSVVMAETACA